MTHLISTMQMTLVFSLMTFLCGYGMVPSVRQSNSIPGLPMPIQNVTQLIVSAGYPCEEYIVETEDGFLLSVIRIPHGINNKMDKDLPVAFLQHGLLDSSATWVINPPDEGLGFILADAGFDVFLGNARGNTYSSGNTKYSIHDPAYWNLIDWDNMAAIDLPTMLNRALEISGQESLSYIGHSQGTIMGFAGFPHQPELAAKVDIFVALAPVAWVEHQTSGPLKLLADFDFAWWIVTLGWEGFLPSNEITQYLANTFCEDLPYICGDVLFLLCGWDEANFNYTRIPLYFDNTPAGTSVRNMYHWSQNIRSGKFEKFDYGEAGNMLHYNSSTPPQYEPQNMVKPKVAFFTGSKDDLADPQDVQHLLRVLPQSNQPVLVHNEASYEHLDFTWGVNAHTLIYPQVVDLLKKYSV